MADLSKVRKVINTLGKSSKVVRPTVKNVSGTVEKLKSGIKKRGPKAILTSELMDKIAQRTRLRDKKSFTKAKNAVTGSKKKGSALKTTAKVAGSLIATGAALTTGAEYAKKKNAEAKANANKVKVNANKVQQNVSKVNANTLKNYKNEEKVAENTRKVAANKSKVQSNAVKVYSNAEKVNAEKARTATTNAQKVAANKAKIEANKKKVAANAAKYK